MGTLGNALGFFQESGDPFDKSRPSKLAFPDDQAGVAQSTQLMLVAPISKFILAQLDLPELTTATRYVPNPTPAMKMPKAAMQKHGLLL